MQLVSGYVGRLQLDVAVTTLTCAVRLEDVLLTVRPCPGGGAPTAAPAADATAAEGSPLPEPEPAARATTGGGLGFGIEDGLRLVTAGVEMLLQRMTVAVDRLSVRVEAPAAASATATTAAAAAAEGFAAVLSCAQISWGAAEATMGRGSDPKQQHQQQQVRSPCSVQCAVCCVLCAVCCELCAVCCVLCAVCCVLCATHCNVGMGVCLVPA